MKLRQSTISCHGGCPAITRRGLLAGLGASFSLRHAARAAGPEKPLRGVFVIMATPYTQTKAVDFEDLAAEVDFLDRCGVHGMVWPQLASEYAHLTTEERLRGMEVIARAARGRKPALVLGVQGPNTEAALQYVAHAEKLEPDALIAIPPTEAATLEDFRQYYRALGRATRRPLFIQTTGGAKGITPEVDTLVALAREFPHLGYVKEEFSPVIERMQALSRHRPTMRGIFSGAAGKAMMYEMRLGFDGTMPGAPYADLYAQIWDLWQTGRREQARELFSRLLLLINLEQIVPGTRAYIMKKRGVFKTWVSRREENRYTPEAIQEIEFHFAALKPYLRA